MDSELTHWIKQVSLLEAKRFQVEATISSERSRLKKSRTRTKQAKQAQAILQEVAQEVQSFGLSKIASVVSTCLKSVFKDDPEEPYSFKFKVVKSRGKTEARPVFVRNGIEHDPKSECSGGYREIAAFALRVVSVTMSGLRPLLVLDEPFLGVSSKYRHLVPLLLESLAKEMNLQIVIATNEEKYATGNIIRLEK